MFPLRDSVPSRRFPFVNTLIIILNVVMFWKQIGLATHGQLDAFMLRCALIPSAFLQNPVAHIPNLVVSMFMHGSWGHIIGNMWFLYIFGDNVEDRLGPIRYAVYYLLMGVCAALAQVYMSASSSLPMIGASGAIAGVLGGYIVLYPHARVLTFFVFIIFVRFIEVPAFFFLGIWFLMQAFSGFGSLTVAARGDVGGVAWWAHAGGFLAGFIFINIFRRR